MVARVYIGDRGGGQYGIWASPPGIDAATADASQLILQMSNLVDQIVLTGSVYSPQVVPLGLSARPLVLLISQGVRAGFGNCATRPSPLANDQRNSTVDVYPSSMYVNAQQPVMYAVFRKTF